MIDMDDLLVIEIPTVSIDSSVNLVNDDLGMAFNDYDNLIFDIITNEPTLSSPITSMYCKLLKGIRVIK